ncbi:hypothetical protein LK09_17765 [Microbacterium mangrovi]|uniref:Excreted virulence factor EspC, type VII ESX diderm n=1 Tax=Microbacterium mangrovi TaxID=1348253 RepID=A0A0B1ZYP8_9MICO|nr:hypothetical protein [Microbacterium mangrovi]KHK95866.1 hypothetical protein LK09_17765 [Microbacterium mangrovi]
MDPDYEVDTDVLRTMARDARAAANRFGSIRIACPSSVGDRGVSAAAHRFSTAWSQGLTDRVDDIDDFARRLDTTARLFEEGQNAAKAELDGEIWSS